VKDSRAPWFDQCDDRASRERALDPSRSFIVQAPAGSGKTELLIQRMLSLLADARHPSEVLAVTFTKKAAGEMRERLLAALQAAHNDSEPHDSPARERWQLARAVVARDAALDWRLTSRPALLNIDTFDAFSLRVAKLAPLGIDTSQSALAALIENAAAMHREAARRAVVDASDAEDIAAVSKLLIALDNRVDSIVELLAELLGKRALWMDRFIDDSNEAVAAMRDVLVTSIESTIANLHALWPADITQRVAALAAYASEHTSDPTRQARALSIASSTFTDSSIERLHEWRALSLFLLTGEATWRKQFNKSDGFPAPSDKGIDKDEKQGRTAAKEAIAKLLDDLQSQPQAEAQRRALAAVNDLPDAEAIAAHEPMLRAALRVLKLAAGELMLIERDSATTDFSGVALAARLALLEYRDEVFARFDASIRHILVDEFQDTNPAQAALIETLVEDWRDRDGRTLFLVGDPMQSIYAFRDADVGIFVEAWSHGIAHIELTPLMLTANYRSRVAIVDWVNRTLESVFADADASHAQPRVPFARALATRDDNGEAKHPERWAFAAASDEARAIVADIARVQSVAPKETIAVIVRAKRHANELLRELQAARIDFTAREMATWSDRPLIRDLLSLTYVLAQPGDRLSWYAWLRSPMVGLSLATFATLGEQQERARRELPWLLCDEHWLATLPLDERTRIEHATAALSQAKSAANLGTLAERVHATFRACGGDAITTSDEAREEVEAYLTFLDEQTNDGFLRPRMQFEAQLAQQFRSFSLRGDSKRGDGSSPPVEVLTMHKAKGLEWHHVYLPQLDRMPSPEKRKLITWSFVRHRPIRNGENERSRIRTRTDKQEPAQLLVAAKESRRRTENSVFQFVHDLGVTSRAEEAKRLLYVAVTRARERLVLSGGGSKAGQPPRSGTLAALVDWPVWAAATEPEANGAALTKRIVMRGSLQRLASRSTVPNKGGVPRKSYPDQEAPDRPDSKEHEVSSNASTEHADEIAFGIVGHKLIEGLALALQNGSDFRPSVRTVVQWLKREGMSESVVADAAAELIEATVSLRQSKHFAFIHDSSHVEAADELTVAAGNVADAQARLMRLDRTFVTSERVRWIVDYKFARPPKQAEPDTRSLEAWLDLQSRQYADQLDRYVRAFGRIEPERTFVTALYYPLLDRLLRR
jgi:ATP-dependent helicase/nuclease subunit A